MPIIGTKFGTLEQDLKELSKNDAPLWLKSRDAMDEYYGYNTKEPKKKASKKDKLINEIEYVLTMTKSEDDAMVAQILKDAHDGKVKFYKEFNEQIAEAKVIKKRLEAARAKKAQGMKPKKDSDTKDKLKERNRRCTSISKIY